MLLMSEYALEADIILFERKENLDYVRNIK